MCLIIKNYKDGMKPRKASKPITVYKLVRKYLDGRYLSPVMDFEYKPENTYCVDELECYFEYNLGQCVDKGFHTYRKDADIYFDKSLSTKGFFNVNRFCCNALLKCTVPKGARYFKGIKGDIVSDTIIIGEEIEIDPKESGC